MARTEILIVNLHSSKNAGDHALTVESVRQLEEFFPGAQITHAMADSISATPHDEVVESFYGWMRRVNPDGRVSWRWVVGPLALLQAIIAGVVWRSTGKLPSLGLKQSQVTLLRAYTRADVIVSSAGTIFYSSGKVGLQFLLSLFIVWYGWLLGKPIYMLPQSIGPLRRGYERWFFRQVWRPGLLLVREPESATLLQQIGFNAQQYHLVPDVAFAYQEVDSITSEGILLQYGGADSQDKPKLGISIINWGVQNPDFDQAPYEAAVQAAVARFLVETDGIVFFFAQMWGPAIGDDDRIPARRVASAFKETGRVHVIEEPLTAAELKGCYARMELMLATRMHANIFALSVGTPIVAIGFRRKTAGLMQLLGWPYWIQIEDITADNLTDLLVQCWADRVALRAEVARIMPLVIAEAGTAIQKVGEAWARHG